MYQRYNRKMPKIKPPLVELDELLAAEYDYIAQTAKRFGQNDDITVVTVRRAG